MILFGLRTKCNELCGGEIGIFINRNDVGTRRDAFSSLYNGLCPADATSQEQLMTQDYSRCSSADNAGVVRIPDTLSCRLLPGYETGIFPCI